MCASPFSTKSQIQKLKIRHHAKMTTKCPIGPSKYDSSLAHPCVHFETYITSATQSSKMLEQVQFSTPSHPSKPSNLQFGPTVRLLHNISAKNFITCSSLM